ncbi:MAG TPA: alpha/beta hydrolase [Bellilinea sp.]|nr:alpha/beta hydrolase [Bellilinea sp.]
MKTETIQLTTDPNVTLTTYLHEPSEAMPNMAVRPAVLICPGGGYLYCSEREGEPIALAFMAAGYQAFVLRYSVGDQAAFPRPLHDAEFALMMIRRQVVDWQVNPGKIAICGFSAGGHLAAALGTMGRVRPNALILAYPCILESMSDTLPEPIPSLEREVTSQTPPTFIWATAADERVPVENSLEFAAALGRAKVPFEIHIFQDGVHGLALATPVTSAGHAHYVDADAAKWLNLCLVWLEHQFR